MPFGPAAVQSSWSAYSSQLLWYDAHPGGAHLDVVTLGAHCNDLREHLVERAGRVVDADGLIRAVLVHVRCSGYCPARTGRYGLLSFDEGHCAIWQHSSRQHAVPALSFCQFD